MIKIGRPQRTYTEEQKEEIKNAYKKSRNVKERSRLLCLKLRIVKGMTRRQIASITELSEPYIDELIKKYTVNGLESIIAKKQTSHNRNMTPKEEEAFLNRFKEEALKGKILVVSEIIEAYSEVLNGKKVSKSTVYDMLHRNGWRKVMPRGEHPKKADEETIIGFKKKWQIG